MYALAFYVTDLCHEIDPTTCDYASAQKLKKHLIYCFRQGTVLPFPSATCGKPEPPLIISLPVCIMSFVLEHLWASVYILFSKILFSYYSFWQFFFLTYYSQSYAHNSYNSPNCVHNLHTIIMNHDSGS